MFILIVGDITDGFNFYGPFDESEDATDAAEALSSSEEWYIVALEPPAWL